MPQAVKGNILLVSNYPSSVGYAWWLMEYFWTLLASHFEKQGFRAFLAYPAISELPRAIRESNIQAVELDVPGKTPEQRRKLRQFVKTNRIKAVYFTDRPWFAPEYAYLRLLGIRTIVVHDHTPGDRPPVRGLKGFVKAFRHRLPAVNADRQFCVSELMRSRSIENGRIPSEKCLVVQNGIAPVEPGTSSIETIRNNLGVRTETTLCITTGRAHPYKRFDFIIDVAAHIRTNGPEMDITFLLVGDGPELENLRAQVRHLGLEKTVLLPGYRSDARELLHAGDIAMHAARGEGFSLSIVEYMSSGLPVLVPDIPSVKQAIDHRENGIIYGKDDISEAANFIVELASNPGLRKTLSRNARKKAHKFYSLDACTEAFREACEAVFPSAKRSE